MSKQDRPDGKWSFGRRTALKLTGGIALGSASAGAAAADSKSGRKVEGSISFEDRCKTVCIETKPDAWWTVEVEFTSGRTKTYTDDKDKCLSFDRRIKRAWLYKGEDSTEGRELDSARCDYDRRSRYHEKKEKDHEEKERKHRERKKDNEEKERKHRERKKDHEKEEERSRKRKSSDDGERQRHRDEEKRHRERKKSHKDEERRHRQRKEEHKQKEERHRKEKERHRKRKNRYDGGKRHDGREDSRKEGGRQEREGPRKGGPPEGREGGPPEGREGSE